MTYIEPTNLPEFGRSSHEQHILSEARLGGFFEPAKPRWSHMEGSLVNQLLYPPAVKVNVIKSPATNTIHSTVSISKPLKEQLFDALSSFKIRTSVVAMHMTDTWRLGLFRQLDSLLDDSSWDPDDVPPTFESFTTLLRMLLLLAPERRPGLGATSDGEFVAAWTSGDDRLTIYALPRDRVRWLASSDLDGTRESAAGNSTLSRLKDVLSPYHPDRWFRAQHIPQG